MGEGEYDEAIERARSYFLVCAVVSNTLSFGQGGDNLKGFDEDAPDDVMERVKKLAEDAGDRAGHAIDCAMGDEENGRNHSDSESDDERQGNGDEPNEQTSLLPQRTYQFAKRTKRRIDSFGNRVYESLPQPAQHLVDFLSPFFNPALVGAAIGTIIGLTPPLQRLFFNQTDEGGYFNAWLTTPVQNVGELFVTLQVLVVGVKLSLSLRRLKEGHEESSSDVPWRAVIFVTAWKFIVLPAISVPLIWALASYSPVLSNDPILWFAMMMMPAGPPAMRLLAIADVNQAEEAVKMSIARFLTVSGGGPLYSDIC